MKCKCSYLHNNQGIVLPMVLITILVLSILGISLLSISISDNRHSIHQSGKMQAYYLAVSGAETMVDYIIEELSKDYEGFSNFLEHFDENGKTSDSLQIGSGFLKINIKHAMIDDGGQEALIITSKSNVVSKQTTNKIIDEVSVTLLIQRFEEPNAFEITDYFFH